MRLLSSIFLLGLLAGATCNIPGSGDPPPPSDNDNGINAAQPNGSPIPELGAPVSIRIINQSNEQASVLVRFFIGELQVRRTELQVPANSTLPTIGPDLAAAVEITGNYASGGATPSALLIL